MKRTVKFFTLLLACLVLLGSFIACGDTTGTETKTETPSQGDVPSSTETEELDRASVKDDLPKDLTFDGETVTFFVRNDHELWKYEMDVDTILNDTLYDAIYYRNKTVEDRLGVTITTVAQEGTYAKRSSWNDTLRTAVNTKTGDFDTAAIYLSTGSVLAVEGMYYNVIDFPYLNLNKPWWNQSIQDELTLFNTLYYLAGDIAVTEVANTYCMFYNKDLFEKYYGSEGINLYAEVADGKWTIDRLYSLIENVHEDLNANGVVDDGDLVGFVTPAPDVLDSNNDAWVAACGIDITTMVNGVPELTFYSERTVRAFEAVKSLTVSCPGTLAHSGNTYTKFSTGLQMFMKSNLNTGSSLREMKDRYGVLPMPMLEENQEGGYATTVVNTASLVTVLSSLSADRTELVGATLELMAAESYKQVTPSYFEIALKTKFAESPEDATMYDLILGTIQFSFGYCYSTESIRGGKNAQPVGGLFRMLADDIAKEWEENHDAYEENLEKLINGLDEAAFRASYSN